MRISRGGAAADVAPVDLVALADDEGNSVRIKVLGQEPTRSVGLAADIVVETPLVRGRCRLILSASKIYVAFTDDDGVVYLDGYDEDFRVFIDGVVIGDYIYPAHTDEYGRVYLDEDD